MFVKIRIPDGRYTNVINVRNATVTRDEATGLLRIQGERVFVHYLYMATLFSLEDHPPKGWPCKEVTRTTTWWERVVLRKGDTIVEQVPLEEYYTYEPFDRLYDSTAVEVIPND